MRPDRLRTLTLSTVEVTPQTIWTFLEAETEAGLRGAGEASLAGQEAAVAEAMRHLALAAFDQPGTHPAGFSIRRPVDLPAAAAISALDQALWDIAARRRGMPLAQALGTVLRNSVPVYANINRRTRDRSPEAFGQGTRLALAAGHTAIKLAPFDEVRAGSHADALHPGLARIAAVREIIGPDAELMIDCHWRFDPALASHLVAASAEIGVNWIECPLPEAPETAAAIAQVRSEANRRGILLAGLETGVGVEGFEPYVRAGAYDVMMPDLKYVGGLTEALRLAEALRAADVGFSLHNPTGPICHAASLHLCAVVPELHSLEVQFDETALFGDLVGADLQRVREGAIAVPGAPGLSAVLQDGPMAQHRVRQWQFTRSGTTQIEERIWAK